MKVPRGGGRRDTRCTRPVRVWVQRQWYCLMHARTLGLVPLPTRKVNGKWLP